MRFINRANFGYAEDLRNHRGVIIRLDKRGPSKFLFFIIIHPKENVIVGYGVRKDQIYF